MIELALCCRACRLASVRNSAGKQTLASSSGVIAARYSIIADPVESSFIVNGRAMPHANGDVGQGQTWPMPTSQYPSEQIVEISMVWAFHKFPINPGV